MDNIEVRALRARIPNASLEMHHLKHANNGFNRVYRKYKNESMHKSMGRYYYASKNVENLSFSEGLVRVLKIISEKNSAHNAIIFPNTHYSASDMFMFYRLRGIRTFSLFGSRAFGFDKDPRGFMAMSYKDNILRSMRSIRNLYTENRVKLFDNCRCKYYQGRNVFDGLMEEC